MAGSQGDAAKQEHRAPTLFEAVFPVASLVVLVAIAFLLFGDAGAKGPNQVALVVATMIAVAFARRRGYGFEELNEAATASVGSGVGAIFILFAVGALIGTWALSGTLLAMVYYGLHLLSPSYFYLTSAITCAVVSVCIGSSWTVVGTIGIGLMGIALNMGLDPAIAAGAIISGAYFGDTVSPLSDSANLAAGAANVPLYEHLRQVVPSSAVALGVALVVFWLLGRPGEFDASHKLDAIAVAMHVSLLLFLPLLVVVALALARLPPFTTIFVGALAGGLLAVFVAPERVLAFADPAAGIPAWLGLVKGVWLALASGYVSTTGNSAVDQLATRGGMESMLGTIWLVISAFAFGGIVEHTGVLARLVAPILNAAKSFGSLVAALVAAVLGTNLFTADQYLAIVLPARMFRGAFETRGLPPVVLSRTVGAAATPTSALIPWNSCGAYMAATLGVATFAYAPFAVFSLASPLVVIAAACFARRATKANGPE